MRVILRNNSAINVTNPNDGFDVDIIGSLLSVKAESITCTE